jgi:transposase
MQFKTMLHAVQRRAEFPQYEIKQPSPPWAGRNSRLTLLFEQLAIAVFLATQTIKNAQAILGTTWDETCTPCG